MGSSVPAALDWLVAQARLLDECAPPVVVQDGWPAVRSDQLVVIGINPEEDDAESVGVYAELDAAREYESVQVPNIIAVRHAGTAATSSARAAAFAIFDAIKDLVRMDRRLGGAVVPGLPARVARWSISQTADVRKAGEGRVCEIRFAITWQHRG
jgi:hypothetical protein